MRRRAAEIPLKNSAIRRSFLWNPGEEPMTAGGGNLIGSEVIRNKRSAPWAVAPIEDADRRLMKNNCCNLQQLYLESGGDLLSRAVTSQVPSALKGLTSVFGMGTGGTPSSLPPEMVSVIISSHPDDCTVSDSV